MRKTYAAASATRGMASFGLIACLGLACSDSTLTSEGSGDSAAAGHGGAGALGGALGSGGAGSGGASSLGGAGGTRCPMIGQCYPLDCPNGSMPDPSPCGGCPVCAPADASIGKDATTDACLALPCAPVLCPAGQTAMQQPCACQVCVPVDAGPIDAVVCPRSCPAVRCAYGTVRDPVCGCDTCVPPDAGPEVGGAIDASPSRDAPVDACLPLPCAYPLCAVGYTVVTHACGCPTCEPVDAGTSTDVGKLDCVGLDECSCAATNGCSVIAEACYCPFPKCNQNGACICGGGKFIGCAAAP